MKKKLIQTHESLADVHTCSSKSYVKVDFHVNLKNTIFESKFKGKNHLFSHK